MNYPSNDDSQFFFIECLSTEKIFPTIKEENKIKKATNISQ